MKGQIFVLWMLSQKGWKPERIIRGRKRNSKCMRETAQQREGIARRNFCCSNHSRDKGKAQELRWLAVSANLNIKVQGLECKLQFSNITFLKHPHHSLLKWFDYFAAHALLPPTSSIFSFPVLLSIFKVIWNFSTVEEQPALFYLLKACLISCCSYSSHQLQESLFVWQKRNKRASQLFPTEEVHSRKHTFFLTPEG